MAWGRGTGFPYYACVRTMNFEYSSMLMSLFEHTRYYLSIFGTRLRLEGSSITRVCSNNIEYAQTHLHPYTGVLSETAKGFVPQGYYPKPLSFFFPPRITSVTHHSSIFYMPMHTVGSPLGGTLYQSLTNCSLLNSKQISLQYY